MATKKQQNMTPVLNVYKRPRFSDATMVIGFSGWMNGGEVSTASVQYLVDTFEADVLAEIEPEGFYLYSFPGSMELASLFRPETKVEEGLVKRYDPPESTFYYSRKQKLIFLVAKEPHLAWEAYADCIFDVCRRFHVSRILFPGSVAGLTPHTREPTITCISSSAKIRDILKDMGLKPTNYEGPASFVTLLTARAPKEGVSMVSLVAEIPAYVDGYNPRCVETMTRCLARLLDIKLDLAELQLASQEFERKLTSLVKTQPDLEEKIKELETDYDRDAFNRDMTDLKTWLEQQGIKVE